MNRRTVHLLIGAALAGTLSLDAAEKEKGAPMAEKSFHSFSMKTIDGQERPLKDYKGRAVLVVNTASKCGYTKQYAGLEQLYQSYKDKGFAIAAFPANDFGAQEPGTNEEIKNFCEAKFKTTFDLYSKITVKGEGIDPLYQFLTTRPGMTGDIKWNFNKFLVDKDGNVVARFDSKVEPLSETLTGALDGILPKK